MKQDTLTKLFNNYLNIKDECSKSGDFGKYAELFVDEDAFVDHHGFGIFKGRRAIHDYITKSIAPFGTMYFTIDWIAYDETSNAVVFQVQNVLPDPPIDPQTKQRFQFPNWTRLVFDEETQKIRSEETVYNPLRDAGKTVKAWRHAGGIFKSKEQLKYQFSVYPEKSKL